MMHLRGGLAALLLAASVLIFIAVPTDGACAQTAITTPPAGNPVRVVTYDEVNAIAHTIYCPVCPNERLDSCQTTACVTWRDEIRQQLEQGRTEAQIVAYFVERYGERAVGIPQDPLLRAFSLATPYLIAGIALVAGLLVLRRTARPALPAVSIAPTGDDEYRRRLDDDLHAR